jgi:aminoglycoside phosphotransferase (APT) family kinase protein
MAVTPPDEQIEGIDVANVTSWFVDNVPGAQPPLGFTLIAGGRSNLTFAVTDAAGNRWALRRPPTGHVLPTAHDMRREHRIIAALGAHTHVPVAPAIGFCDDAAVNGAPFYVMGFVDGHILRDASHAKALTPEQRRTAGEDLVDVLAAIHAVDVDAVGLGDLGRKEGYIERQLKRWYGQFEKSKTGTEVPLVDDLYRRLLAAVPPQGPATIVHGDYRLDNTMLGEDGRVRAVLDWEICTLGDPLADVGLLMVYWAEPGDPAAALLVAPTALDGFPTRAELQARYAEQAGRDVSELGFYVAFGYWKLACILQGVYERYLGGAGGGDRSGFEGFAAQVVKLSELADEAAQGIA